MSKMSIAVSTINFASEDVNTTNNDDIKEISDIVESVKKMKTTFKKLNLHDEKQKQTSIRESETDYPRQSFRQSNSNNGNNGNNNGYQQDNTDKFRRTKMCVSFHKKIPCRFLSECTFAHSESELNKLMCSFNQCLKVINNQNIYTNKSPSDICNRFHENESFSNWVERIAPVFAPYQKPNYQQPAVIVPLLPTKKVAPASNQQPPVVIQSSNIPAVINNSETPFYTTHNYHQPLPTQPHVSKLSLDDIYITVQKKQNLILHLYSQMFSELEAEKFKYDTYINSSSREHKDIKHSTETYNKNIKQIKDRFIFSIREQYEYLSELLTSVQNF